MSKESAATIAARNLARARWRSMPREEVLAAMERVRAGKARKRRKGRRARESKAAA